LDAVQLTLLEKIGRRTLHFKASKLICVGYSGRNREKVLKHIEELKKIGVPPPEKVPMIIPVSTYTLTNEDDVEVQSSKTSAEVEYVVLVGRDETYITVGSDHTDRELEKLSIEKAKQVCPKVIAKEAWHYDDLKDHWDELNLRCYAWRDKERIVYQTGLLKDLINVEELLGLEDGKYHSEGSVIFSGTVPVAGGQIIYSNQFEIELFDPVLKRSLFHRYKVKVL